MIYSSNNNDIISNNASGTTIDAIVLYSDSHDNKVKGFWHTIHITIL